MAAPFVRIEMGKALHGDCLYVEWSGADKTRRMLVDGGPIGAYDALASRIGKLAPAANHFELVVLSHVDTDHIDGMVRLFAERPEKWPFSVGDVWFNGWRHLADTDVLGGNQGEFFSALLTRRLKAGQWNGRFKGGAVVVPETGPLPLVDLGGGMTLTLLSPSAVKLAAMRKAWAKDLQTSQIRPGDLEGAWDALAKQKKYLPDDGLLSGKATLDQLLAKQSRPDQAAANGSSIAFLAEHPAGSCLFLADAHPDVVCASIKRLLAARKLKRLEVDAVKVAHHGSRANTDDALMGLVASPRWLVSTNGAIFGHPDDEAIARIIKRSTVAQPTLYFNYLTPKNESWAPPARQKSLKYRAVYQRAADAPLEIVLERKKEG